MWKDNKAALPRRRPSRAHSSVNQFAVRMETTQRKRRLCRKTTPPLIAPRRSDAGCLLSTVYITGFYYRYFTSSFPIGRPAKVMTAVEKESSELVTRCTGFGGTRSPESYKLPGKMYTVCTSGTFILYTVCTAAVDVFRLLTECDARPGNKRLAVPASPLRSLSKRQPR